MGRPAALNFFSEVYSSISISKISLVPENLRCSGALA
jgi:hypothetical protein